MNLKTFASGTVELQASRGMRGSQRRSPALYHRANVVLNKR